MINGKHRARKRREKTRRGRASVFVEEVTNSDVFLSFRWACIDRRLSGRCNVISTNNWFVWMFFFFAFNRLDEVGKGFNSNGWPISRAVVVGESFRGGFERFWFGEIDVLGKRNFFIYIP